VRGHYRRPGGYPASSLTPGRARCTPEVRISRYDAASDREDCPDDILGLVACERGLNGASGNLDRRHDLAIVADSGRTSDGLPLPAASIFTGFYSVDTPKW
jgi:hypothetical protein